MPSPYEHLTTAEQLLSEARHLLKEERPRTATAYTRLASAFLEAASARERIIPEPPTVPTARLGPLPEWCGNCDGPDIALRWIEFTPPGKEHSLLAKCPACHPAAHQRTTPAAESGIETDSTLEHETCPSPAEAVPADFGQLTNSVPAAPPE
ncbi:hypothetical protein ACWGRV_27095 [Streptomyces sp. NPDC055663]